MCTSTPIRKKRQKKVDVTEVFSSDDDIEPVLEYNTANKMMMHGK